MRMKNAIDDVLKSIEAKFGVGSVMKLDGKAKNMPSISTGSFTLDQAIGIGGIPQGRITEIFGPESSGKTTLAYHIMAESQKLGGRCALIDAEHSFDEGYAQNIGLDTNNLIVCQPDSGENALGILGEFVKSPDMSVVVVDSVAALVPIAEIMGEMGDAHIGLQARMMSQAMRKITGDVSKNNVAVIFINQIRINIGGYGNPETTSGGKALRFFASVRIDIRKGLPIKEGEEVIGNKTRCKLVKNKVAPPYKIAEFDIIYNKGISKSGELVDSAVQKGIISKGGAWFKYGEEKFQGRESIKNYLESDNKVMHRLETEIDGGKISENVLK